MFQGEENDYPRQMLRKRLRVEDTEVNVVLGKNQFWEVAKEKTNCGGTSKNYKERIWKQ